MRCFAGRRTSVSVLHDAPPHQGLARAIPRRAGLRPAWGAGRSSPAPTSFTASCTPGTARPTVANASHSPCQREAPRGQIPRGRARRPCRVARAKGPSFALQPRRPNRPRIAREMPKPPQPVTFSGAGKRCDGEHARSVWSRHSCLLATPPDGVPTASSLGGSAASPALGLMSLGHRPVIGNGRQECLPALWTTVATVSAPVRRTRLASTPRDCSPRGRARRPCRAAQAERPPSAPPPRTPNQPRSAREKPKPPQAANPPLPHLRARPANAAHRGRFALPLPAHPICHPSAKLPAGSPPRASHRHG